MTTMADKARQMLLEDADDDVGTDYMQALEQQAVVVKAKSNMSALTKKVTDILEKGQIPSKRRLLHVSDVMGRKKLCMRKMVLLSGYEQDALVHAAELSLRFELGNAIHRLLQGNVSRAVQTYGVEMQHIETFWRLLFTPDIVADFEWEDGKWEPTIWELKGYHDREFRDLTLKGKMPVDAMMQCMIYMWFTGIHRGIVVVMNKNTQALAAWEVVYDESLVLPHIPTFDTIKVLFDEHLQDQQNIPDRLPECTSVDDKVPQACAACTACFASDADRIAMRLQEVWAA